MATPNDRLVLNAILNSLCPGAVDERDEVQTISDLKDTHDSNAEREASEIVARAKTLELDGVKAAEQSKLDEAVDLLSRAIDLCPDRASCFNNRAQTRRLKGDVEGALEDLERAIELSNSVGNVACQAFTQRAMIYRLRGEGGLAKSDFEKAAHLGSAFAKTQLVAMNPYAAMCNKMIAEVMAKLQRGEAEDSTVRDKWG